MQVQHNIENVAANEANLEAKIEKKKVGLTSLPFVISTTSK